MYSKLQYISQGATQQEQLENILSALDAGCDWVQLRFKNATEKEFLDTAEKVKMHCDNYGATYIINDHINVAKQVDADGVHLGLTDSSIKMAREILGANKIIGGTANTLEHVLQRIDEVCNYVGLGPFRFTATKEKLSPILGLEGYKKIIAALKANNKYIPIYAIGGIVVEDVESIANADIYGIAVSGIITNAINKKEIVSQLNTKLHVIA